MESTAPLDGTVPLDGAVPLPEPDSSPNHALRMAAIAVVERAGTPAVTMAEIAATAEVDLAVASGLYPSLDDLLVEAALAMCAEELRLSSVAQTAGAPTVSAYAHHFASRRDFYRAMRAAPVAQLLDARMAELMAPLIAIQVRTLVGPQLTDDALAAMTVAATEESFRVTNGWIVESSDAEGAESLYVQLEGIVLRSLEEARALRDDS